MTKAVTLTAAALRQAMSVRWAAPEYAIMWEVGDATGARATRWSDAVIDCPLPLPAAETDLAAGLRRISRRTAA